MKKFARVFLLVTAFSTAAQAVETPPSFADMVEKLTPTVVNISTTQKVKGGGVQMFNMPEGEEMPDELRQFFEQFMKRQSAPGGGQQLEQDATALGSGFVIDENGYIATNNHVIADAEEITVTFSDDSKLKAKIVGRDAKTDLALLKVEADHKLPAVTLGDSDAARVGDWVIAIGNPFGFGGTVTAGIISGRARNINSGPFDDFIQTDAAVNRGNSGGPMFNAKGEVIGINSAIFSPNGGSVGIGFAVPVALAKPVFEQLKSSGKIERGLLGVKIQPVTDEAAESMGMKKPTGALVLDVTKDGPAHKAGIKAGDIILKFDGREVKEMRFLPRMVAETAIGKTVDVELLRGGKPMTLKATLAEMKDEEQESAAPGEKDKGEKAKEGKDVAGLTLAPITRELRKRFGVGEDAGGVIVTRVEQGSEAAKRGFKQGDVVSQVGETQISNVKEFEAALDEAGKAGRKYALIRVLRSGEFAFVTLPLEKK